MIATAVFVLVPVAILIPAAYFGAFRFGSTGKPIVIIAFGVSLFAIAAAGLRRRVAIALLVVWAIIGLPVLAYLSLMATCSIGPTCL